MHGDGFENDGVYANFYENADIKGSYTFTATATGSTTIGDYFTRDSIISCYLKENKYPIAIANGPYSYEIYKELKFDGSDSYDPDGTIVSYEWDFGDGNTDIGMIQFHQYDTIDNYTVTLTVTDNYGLTNTDTTYAIMGYGHPPQVQIMYPKGGETLKDRINIEWSAYDSDDGNNLPIYLYISDDEKSFYPLTDNPIENTGEYSWDTNDYPDGGYTLLVEAIDSDRNIGHDSKIFTIKNYEEPPNNNAPDKPNRPTGENEGKIDEEYSFTTSTNDIDGDQVYYKWDWDDETSGWLGPYNSGETCEASHIWDDEGSYSIKVKAKDQYGDESPWSDPLSITMPKKKMFNSFPRILLWLFERFPFLQPFFNY
jgi:PKD repeat protein